LSPFGRETILTLAPETHDMRSRHRLVLLLSAVVLSSTTTSAVAQQSQSAGQEADENLWCYIYCNLLLNDCYDGTHTVTYCTSFFQGCLYNCEHPEG
jgi:hypothetical protein